MAGQTNSWDSNQRMAGPMSSQGTGTGGMPAQHDVTSSITTGSLVRQRRGNVQPDLAGLAPRTVPVQM